MFDDLGIVIPIRISAAATMSTQCNQSMEHIWSVLLHNRWNVFVGCGRNTSQRILRLASVADLSENSDMAKKACEARLKAQAGRGGQGGGYGGRGGQGGGCGANEVNGWRKIQNRKITPQLPIKESSASMVFG